MIKKAVMKYVSKHPRLLVLAAIAYLVMPFDLVPDVLPGVGLIDDAVVLGAVLAVLRGGYARLQAARATTPSSTVRG